MMATYRQLRESLGIHEGLAKSRKEADPGDIWQVKKTGNWYGMKQGKEGEENPTDSFGSDPISKKKAKAYAVGGDPDKVDDNGQDEKEPEKEKDEKEPEKTSDNDTERSRPESVEGINDYQSELEKKRDMGIAGAGGQKASQGESRYCNALNTLNNDNFRKENKESIDAVAAGVKSGNIKLKKGDIDDLEAIGLDPKSDEGAQYIATREIFAEKELERIKGIKGSVFHQSNGFGGDEEAYREWMRVAYDGTLATRKILREDTDLDVSKPHTILQSEKKIDDDVAADLQKKVEEAQKAGNEKDEKYYQTELDDFQHFREYHDTYAVGQDVNGRTHIVSISNKKGSELRDPQNNTTPAKRLTVIQKDFGPKVAKKVTESLNKNIELVSNTKKTVIKEGNDVEIDDSIAGMLDTDTFKSQMKKLNEISDPDRKNKKGKPNPTAFAKWYTENNKKPFKDLSTKEKLQAMQGFSKEEQSNGKTPSYNPFGRIWTKIGENARNETFRKKHPDINYDSPSIDKSMKIKKDEQEVVEKAHQNVVNDITEADKEQGFPDEDGNNGPHTQGYVNTVMDAMHFNTYIDGGDKKMIVQMGIRGGQPSQVRGCLAELSGFEGNADDDKEGLKEHLKKRCRIDAESGSILIKDSSGERVLAEDTWRTAGADQKVASGFGDEIRECIMNKIDSKAAKGERGKVSPKYESLEGTISRMVW